MNRQWIDTLLGKYRSRGVLIDSNILLLYVVGAISPRRIPTFKRTSTFAEEDFTTLTQLLAPFARLVTTPHIMTQVSNLVGQMSRNETAQAHIVRARLVATMEETYVETAVLGRHHHFAKLGVADTGILSVTGAGLLVLTDDVALADWLGRAGIDALNFNHIRMAGLN